MRSRFQRAALLLLAPALPCVALADTHTIRMENMQFVPAVVTVQRGDTLVWQNADLVPHTATAKARFDSGLIAAGKSWQQAAPAPGSYDVICSFHPGMKARLVVK